MAGKSPEIKRRKLNEDDFRMEISSDDHDDIENLWTTLPPDIVNAILSRLPYEKCGQLALACWPWEWTYVELLERGFLCVSEAIRKWQDWKWPPLPCAEDFATLNSMFQNLILALRGAEFWGKGLVMRRRLWDERNLGNYREFFVIMGQTLDQAARCHRDMLHAIRARLP